MAAPIPAVSVSRPTGVAPLAVFFDASGTTDADTTKPFHDLFYMWNFGDSGSGAWGNGANTSLSKNLAFGPVAAHVYETAGTYTWSMLCYDGTTAVITTNTVTVTAADTQWSTTKTICFSTSGNFTGAPTGATQVTYTGASSITSNLAADRRLLFRRGETFDIASAVTITQNGPGMFGAFGTGAKPIINSSVNGNGINVSNNTVTGTAMADWRFVDLVFDGNDLASASAWAHSGPVNNVLYLRCEARRIKNGIIASISVLDVQNGSGFVAPVWDGLFVQDCTIGPMVPTPGNGGNGLYLAAARMAVMGNYINNALGSEHGFRTAFIDRGVVSNNTVTGIPSGRAFITLRSPDQGSLTLSGGGYPNPYYTEKIVGSNNYCFGGETSGQCGVGPTNQSSTGLARNIIWERNYQVASATSVNLYDAFASDISIRNNVFVGGVGIAYIKTTGYDFAVGYADPTNFYISNNTGYTTENGSVLMFQQTSYNTTGVATATIANNLVYAPNDNTGTDAIYSTPDIAVTATGNTNSSGQIRTSPQFVGPLTSPLGFTVSAASYAADGGGAQFPAQQSDFYNGRDKSSENRIGALVQTGQSQRRGVAA